MKLKQCTMDIFAIKESAELGLRVSGRAFGSPGFSLWDPLFLNKSWFIYFACTDVLPVCMAV